MSPLMLPLALDELLTTTRSVRKRLDLERPVARDLIERCIDIAVQAPNGSNQQYWRWVIVDDPTLRQRVANLYRAGMQQQIDNPGYRRDVDYTTPEALRIGASVGHLAEHLHQVPALVIPVMDGKVEGLDAFAQASHWGSILPAVWNFLLALRAHGLGSSWTTVHLHKASEMAALLGIPHNSTTQVGLFPIAYTLGTDFKPAARKPAREIIGWNGWQVENNAT
jgi:nitroreductase